MGINNSSKKIGFVSAVALLVSGMIGSAIFSMSGLTISYAGPASIISWILAALIQLFYGLAMAELATTYKKNGGVFVFPEETFKGNIGKLLGFMSVWGCMMADIIAIAFSSIYVGRYLQEVFVGIESQAFILPIVAILICLVVNIINFKTTGKINGFLALILGILLLVYSFFALSSKSFSIYNMIPFFTQGKLGTFGFLRAVPIAMIAYSSIMSISFMAGEIDNPKNNIPKAVVVGMGIVVIIYTLVMLSTVGTIKASEIDENGMTYIPLFAACYIKLKHISWLPSIVSIAAVVALITTMIVVLAMSGRNLKAVADKGLLHNVFSKELKSSTPIIAMTFEAICAMILSQFTSLTEILINLGALFAIVTIMINLISLIYARKKDDKNIDHYSAPISNVFIILILLLIVCCYIPDIKNGGIALWTFSISWYLIGFVIFRIKNGRN